MAKIEILIGISNSGKSTYSHQEWLKNPNDVVIVSRDYIRYMYGYDEKNIIEYYNRKDIHILENQVSQIQDHIIEFWLTKEKTIIIDATHLRLSYIKDFLKWNTPIDFKFFDITLEEALERNSKRNRKVDIEIIKKQKEQYDSLRKNSLSEIQSMVNLGYPFLS